MPNITSALKQMKKSERNRQRNKSYKSAMRTQVKKLLKSFEDGSVDVAKLELSKTMRLLDKIAHKNIMHVNNVARKKSALYVQYNQLLAKAVQNKDKKEE